MAKRNRNGEPSRKASGGIRQTSGVRRATDPYIGRSLDQRIGFYDVELDLSAFHVEDARETPFEALARAQESRQPGRTVSMQKRKQPEGRATDYTDRRRAPIQTERRDSRLSLAEGQAVTKQAARTDHLHAERSDKRKERSRPINCKQRPEPTKGGGSSRKFVPWCDRKR